MAHAESKMIMGYLPIEARHHAAILSLVAPATLATRMLDPFAGEGEFLEVAAQTWQDFRARPQWPRPRLWGVRDPCGGARVFHCSRWANP